MLTPRNRFYVEEAGFAIKLSKWTPGAPCACYLVIPAAFALPRRKPAPISGQLCGSGKQAAKLLKGQRVSGRPHLENLYYRRQKLKDMAKFKGKCEHQRGPVELFSGFSSNRMLEGNLKKTSTNIYS